MKRTISISRPASGSGTVVTVTLVENGITVKYALRSFTTGIGSSIRAATNTAKDLLRQAQEEVDGEDS